jgi:hypothetical protein
MNVLGWLIVGLIVYFAVVLFFAAACSINDSIPTPSPADSVDPDTTRG